MKVGQHLTLVVNGAVQECLHVRKSPFVYFLFSGVKEMLLGYNSSSLF